ncbi:hypothetical protein C4D60_Mb06t16980 [Musa balbisiana]|uniref:Uncharacterized protein n=1 Tax=Musa balbisiana TaxID=52838 RepID=A0A4S8INK5_MUSBA|nr:hypothetical protein C4D60_Mb06t16980 [Musa balbisiana]
MQPPKPHLQNLSYLIKERERGVSLLGCCVSSIQNQPIINVVIDVDPMLYIETASESVQLLAQQRASWFHSSGMLIDGLNFAGIEKEIKQPCKEEDC